MVNRCYSFVGGATGEFRITRLDAVKGAPLAAATRLHIENKDVRAPAGATWCLRGVTSFERYVVASEQLALQAVQPPLGRTESTCAALIPVKKSEEWWRLPHDRRREIFETRSAHIATGLKYLPAIARRLHHGYELGEPFDFLTWFEYAERDAAAFEELVRILRGTEEWAYVEREVDIRLVADGS